MADTWRPGSAKLRNRGARAPLTRLGVVSSEGTVYLSGTVESPTQKTRAEEITTRVKGVTRVVNALDVRAAPE